MLKMLFVFFFGEKVRKVGGLRVFEICKKCGKYKTYLVDSNLDWQEKLPESIFTKEEIRNAVIGYKK